MEALTYHGISSLATLEF